MKDKRRVEAIVNATMMTSTQFWQKENRRIEQERDLWKLCADLFAIAETPAEQTVAFEAWERLSNSYLTSEVETK